MPLNREKCACKEPGFHSDVLSGFPVFVVKLMNMLLFMFTLRSILNVYISAKKKDYASEDSRKDENEAFYHSLL